MNASLGWQGQRPGLVGSVVSESIRSVGFGLGHGDAGKSQEGGTTAHLIKKPCPNIMFGLFIATFIVAHKQLGVGQDDAVEHRAVDAGLQLDTEACRRFERAG